MAEVRTVSATGGQKGVKEARFDLIPAGSLYELAVLYGRGALKYDDHNWRRGYEWEKSGASIDRHLNWWRRGFDYDVCSNEPDGCLQEKDGQLWSEVSQTPDTCWNHTGCHHMTCVAWHALALLEFKDRFPDFDNRYATQIASSEDEAESLYEKAIKAFEGEGKLSRAELIRRWRELDAEKAERDGWDFNEVAMPNTDPERPPLYTVESETPYGPAFVTMRREGETWETTIEFLENQLKIAKRLQAAEQGK